MKAIIINNEVRYDEDSLSLADMGYEIGEDVILSVCQSTGNTYLTVKQDVVIDGIVAIYSGEEVCVTDDEVEMVA